MSVNPAISDSIQSVQLSMCFNTLHSNDHSCHHVCHTRLTDGTYKKMELCGSLVRSFCEAIDRKKITDMTQSYEHLPPVDGNTPSAVQIFTHYFGNPTASGK